MEGTAEKHVDLTNGCKKTLLDKNTKAWGTACRERCRQTDWASVSVSGGPLPCSVWGLWILCSPPTPDLHPPDSSPVTNQHFLSIECTTPISFACVITNIIKSAVSPPPLLANISSFFALSLCINQTRSLWVGSPLYPKKSMRLGAVVSGKNTMVTQNRLSFVLWLTSTLWMRETW